MRTELREELEAAITKSDMIGGGLILTVKDAERVAREHYEPEIERLTKLVDAYRELTEARADYQAAFQVHGEQLCLPDEIARRRKRLEAAEGLVAELEAHHDRQEAET